MVDGNINPAGLFLEEQKTNIQKMAVGLAALSVCASLVTIYWFFMMKRNFRRHLILLLILGDFAKSTWYLVFASTALKQGGIQTASAFCQANGFLLQAAIEGCDAAILFMSMHMYLQIFSPTSKILGHDGLFRFRHTVLGLYLIFPLLSASLAFVESNHGYISQGPFCTLPIRPIWYRIALTWIPRYLIWIYIMFVALRIYLHVGRGFKVFARQQGEMSSGDGATDNESRLASKDIHMVKRKVSPDTEQQSGFALHSHTDSFMTSLDDGNCRPSSVYGSPSFVTPGTLDGLAPPAGNESRRSSRVIFHIDGTAQADYLQVPPDQKYPRASESTVSSSKSNGEMSFDGTRTQGLEPIEESRTNAQEEDIGMMSADTPLKKRRRAIQKQLRLLFIYPVVYLMWWIVPFVYHSMLYSDHYAQHPIYGLAVAAVACQTTLGLIDCMVFGWREKPWKHIAGSDGTFLGSFMFWRFGRIVSNPSWGTPMSGHDSPTKDTETQTRSKQSRTFMRSASHTSMRPKMHRKTWSGSSDRTALESERAAERLALERADRDSQPGLHSRNASVSVNHRAPTEWWERRLSEAVLEAPDSPSEGTTGLHQ